MQKLLAVIGAVFSALSGLKSKNDDLASQLNSATADNAAKDQTMAALQLKLTNPDDQPAIDAANAAASAATQAAADATAKATALQSELDSLNAQADQAATDAQTHLDAITQDPAASGAVSAAVEAIPAPTT